MKTRKWLLFLGGLFFLLALPFVWIVASLASELQKLHPAAGWGLWMGAAIAAICLLVPVLQLFRLPPLPPGGRWDSEGAGNQELPWRQMAQQLADTCEEPRAALELRRHLKDLPNDLPAAVRAELSRRKEVSAALRLATMRNAALVSFLSPHRHLDGLILLWINLKQVYQLSRCHGFRPSPRGMLILYGTVAGAAITLEAVDEVAEQLAAESARQLSGGIPLVGQAASLLYDPLRAAAYVGFIGLLSEYLFRNELKAPTKTERQQLRQAAWRAASEEIGRVGSGLFSNTTPKAEPVS